MKVDLKNRLSKESLSALKKSPNVARLGELHAKVRTGKATASERNEWHAKTDWVGKLPKNVLSESHRAASGY